MFLQVLPDPNVKIDTAGLSNQVTGAAGPGFLSETIGFEQKVQQDRSIGGNTVRRTNSHAAWDINIQYNPLTKIEFEPVYHFLMEKRGSRKSFYVSLPQYKTPKDATFAAYAAGNTITTTSAANAGVTTIEITEPTGTITVGDVFNLIDPNDSTHVQTYMVARVETSALNETAPTGGSVRLHFFPRLQKYTASGATAVFNNPLFKVKQKQDIQEYSLDSEGLYSFTLQLEEALT